MTVVRSALAVIMALLGTILVLSGAAALWAVALTRPRGSEPDTVTPLSRVTKGMAAVSQLPAPDRLIVWGVVLLALSAVASGAITFAASASAGTP